MIPSWVGRLGLLAMCAAAAAGCGKKGNPLPPLRPIPARIADLAATRTGDAIELRFTVPAANADGTTPAAIDRVDVYGLQTEPGQAPPPVSQVIGDPQNLRGRVVVGQAPEQASGEAAEPASDSLPRPGEPASYVDSLVTSPPQDDGAVVYAIVPVAGGGRGRPGPPSALISVPMGELPAAPGDVAVDYDEAVLRVTWEALAEGLVYRVFTSPGDVGEGASLPLTPEPIPTAPFTTPVEFGREVCVTVRAFAVTGPVSLAGPPSGRVCTTPEDRYPPPAPSGLRVVQGGAAVVLVWDAVNAPDLAGYVVMRGDGATATLAPLSAAPIAQTTYRDTSAAAGSTYTYTVYAVDSSPAANASPTSEYQTLTVR